MSDASEGSPAADVPLPLGPMQADPADVAAACGAEAAAEEEAAMRLHKAMEAEQALQKEAAELAAAIEAVKAEAAKVEEETAKVAEEAAEKKRKLDTTNQWIADAQRVREEEEQRLVQKVKDERADAAATKQTVIDKLGSFAEEDAELARGQASELAAVAAKAAQDTAAEAAAAAKARQAIAANLKERAEGLQHRQAQLGRLRGEYEEKKAAADGTASARHEAQTLVLAELVETVDKLQAGLEGMHTDRSEAVKARVEVVAELARVQAERDAAVKEACDLQHRALCNANTQRAAFAAAAREAFRHELKGEQLVEAEAAGLAASIQHDSLQDATLTLQAALDQRRAEAEANAAADVSAAMAGAAKARDAAAACQKNAAAAQAALRVELAQLAKKKTTLSAALATVTADVAEKEVVLAAAKAKRAGEDAELESKSKRAKKA